MAGCFSMQSPAKTLPNQAMQKLQVRSGTLSKKVGCTEQQEGDPQYTNAISSLPARLSCLLSFDLASWLAAISGKICMFSLGGLHGKPTTLPPCCFCRVQGCVDANHMQEPGTGKVLRDAITLTRDRRAKPANLWKCSGKCSEGALKY